MKQWGTRALALVLTLVLGCSAAPMPGRAADEEEEPYVYEDTMTMWTGTSYFYGIHGFLGGSNWDEDSFIWNWSDEEFWAYTEIDYGAFAGYADAYLGYNYGPGTLEPGTGIYDSHPIWGESKFEYSASGSGVSVSKELLYSGNVQVAGFSIRASKPGNASVTISYSDMHSSDEGWFGNSSSIVLHIEVLGNAVGDAGDEEEEEAESPLMVYNKGQDVTAQQEPFKISAYTGLELPVEPLPSMDRTWFFGLEEEGYENLTFTVATGDGGIARIGEQGSAPERTGEFWRFTLVGTARGETTLTMTATGTDPDGNPWSDSVTKTIEVGGFDRTKIVKAYLLNNPAGASNFGHQAVLLVDEEGYSEYFSFGPRDEERFSTQMRALATLCAVIVLEQKEQQFYSIPGLMKRLTLSQAQTKLFVATGLIDGQSYRRIAYSVSHSAGEAMYTKALGIYIDQPNYSLAFSQCDDKVGDIFRAGGIPYDVSFLPRLSFFLAKQRVQMEEVGERLTNAAEQVQHAADEIRDKLPKLMNAMVERVTR